MNDSTTFCVFDREIPSELVEPLIAHLCKQLEDTTFSFYKEDLLDFSLAVVKSKYESY